MYVGSTCYRNECLWHVDGENFCSLEVGEVFPTSALCGREGQLVSHYDGCEPLDDAEQESIDDPEVTEE